MRTYRLLRLLIIITAQAGWYALTVSAADEIQWKLLPISAGSEGTTIQIPKDRYLLCYPLGRWDPASGGTLGINVSSLGATGVSHLLWKSTYPGKNNEGWTLYGPDSAVPPAEFIAPDENYFSLLYKKTNEKEWRTFKNTELKQISGGATIEFRMNDQYDHFFNNDSNLHLMYTIQEKSFLKKAQKKAAIEQKHRFMRQINLPDTTEGYTTYQYALSDLGVYYDWEIVWYHPSLEKYRYNFYFWNTSLVAIRSDVTFIDNLNNSREIFLQLDPGQYREILLEFLPGMTIDPSKTTYTDNKAIQEPDSKTP